MKYLTESCGSGAGPVSKSRRLATKPAAKCHRSWGRGCGSLAAVKP